MSPTVSLAVDGTVATVRLERPEVLNALNDEVRVGLTETFTRLVDRPDVSVVVIEGAGRAFCAGADLVGGSGSARAGETWAVRRHRAAGWNRVLDLIDALPQVTVAKLRSHVIGGGALLAVACDLRIASDDLTVRIPEVALGLPLTWGGVPRLAREIGLPLARDLVLTGRAMRAEEAKACGFVQQVEPASDLDARLAEIAAGLAVMPSGPLAVSKAMFAALSRSAAGPAGWADPDLLLWSPTETESQEAAAAYVGRLGK